MRQAQQKEPERLREHVETFNDAVIAIIITIIVLQIQPAFKTSQYLEFLGNIVIFIIAFFIIADFWYDLHLAFSYFIFKPDKITAICDFCLLATYHFYLWWLSGSWCEIPPLRWQILELCISLLKF